MRSSIRPRDSAAAFEPGRYIAFYLADDPTARCFVALHDHAEVNPLALEWARIVGMVNVSADDVARHRQVVPVGPTFGVRLSRRLTARHVWHAARFAGAKGSRSVVQGAITHERRRVTSDAYIARPGDPDYVFFTAWPWAKHPEVNPPRVRFIEAAHRAPGLEFDGGFAPRRRSDLPELLPYTAARRYGIGEYLDKVARSAVAFNNPAVHGCLGWKLGEFLALGKAIVTMPLGRALPEPLDHGVHVHVVDGSADSFDDALERIRSDDAYRHSLELNARAWYERNLEPSQCVGRLLAMVGSRP